MSVQNEMDELTEGARAVLRKNDLGAWTKPAPNLYPHQWNWDSAFIAIGYSHVDTARAMTEIKSLLRGQWANGMVPQIVFNPEGKGYFPGPDVWQSTRSPAAPRDVMTSGITQPPILATACLAIHTNAAGNEREAALAFLREVYPHLLAYHRFFYEERNPDHDGLIVVLHPWESGLDNSPPYLEAGKRVRMAYKPRYHRLDTSHVAAKYRPSDRDYDLYVYLLEQMRDDNWDQHTYLQHAPLQIQDILFNSILCRAGDDLATIATLADQDPAPARDWAESTRRAINARLWNEAEGMYYSFDRVAGQQLTEATITGLTALYGRAADRVRAERLVEVHLLNPRQFWPENGWPVPTTALDSSWFNPENYWLGPTWVATNWLLIHGLLDSGHPDLAARLTTHTLDLVARSGFREYYNPYSGEGYGTGDFSWSAALTIDLITALERT